MPEKLLLLSLRILRTFSLQNLSNDQKARRILRLNAARESLLKNTPLFAADGSSSNGARLELVRYLETVSRKKLKHEL